MINRNTENSNTESKSEENRNTESRNAENKNTEGKSAENKNTESKNAENKNTKNCIKPEKATGKESVKQKLRSLADEKYRKFSAGLIPGADNMLGVRLPDLRKLGKELSKEGWQAYLADADDEYYEETMLQGIVIGLVKTDVEESLQLVAGFVPKINNWAVCDSFSAGLVFVKKNKQRVWDFLKTYVYSDREYELRFAAVMLMDYFIDEEHIDAVLKLLDGIRHEGYYVKMAVAWALSVCFVKFPEKTMEYLKNNSLDDFTHNKALQKIVESNRVDGNTKNLIRGMKRKNI